MPDVKEIVSKMIAQGMSPEEVKSNLEQLGFSNAEKIIAEVSEKSGKKEESREPSGFSMTSIDDSGEEKELNMLVEEGGDSPKQVTTGSYDSVKIAKQLDDAIGLMKSIEKLNKDILKANQEIITKLDKQ
jgi:hypothetical protein